jgi:hypothetical protein
MASDTRSTKPPAEEGFLLGAELFEKISAVEGIELTDDMLRRARESERLKLSPDERRECIKAVYRKS